MVIFKEVSSRWVDFYDGYEWRSIPCNVKRLKLVHGENWTKRIDYPLSLYSKIMLGLNRR